MKKIIAVLLCMLLLCGFAAGCSTNGNTSTASSSAKADTSWEKVLAKGELVLGLDDAFPPMGYRDENNEIVGFDIDLAKEVCSRLGIKLKLQPIAWDSKDMELKTGNIDCIWNGFTINGRETEYNFTKPYMKNKQVLMVLDGSSYQTLANLAGKVIAVQKDSSAANALDSAEAFKATIKNQKAVEFEDNLKARLDLDVKQSDALVIDEVVAKDLMSKNQGKYRILSETLTDEDYGVGFRIGDDALKNKIEETLIAMSKDGKMAEISTKWFGGDITTIEK